MPEATRRRPARATALVVLWSVVMLSVVLASGCYGRNCEGDVAFFGRTPGEGRLVSEDTWESGPINGRWLPFPRQRLWFFDLHELGDRELVDIRPFVSAQSDPFRESGNFTVGSGNLTEISGADRGRVAVKNGTCADYYLRLVVVATPRPSEPETPTIVDAGGQ